MGLDEAIQRMGQGKHGVDIRDRQQLGLAGLEPLDLGKGLALGTVTVATGVVGEALEPTVGARFGVATQLGGTTRDDIGDDTLLRGADGIATLVIGAVEAEDIRHFPAGRVMPLGRRWRSTGVRGRHGISPSG
jgi:hypothetical protein